ncbi:MAG TPA: alpha/beta fold hydrolase [Planctomycetes bacterium]|nr:alpha/beta fold hydrolase [Planctomycetota bacterium]
MSPTEEQDETPAESSPDSYREVSSAITLPVRSFFRPARGRARSLLVALHGMGQSARYLEARLGCLRDPERALLIPDAPLPFEMKSADGSRREGHAWYIYTGDQEAFLQSARRTAAWLKKLIVDVRRAENLETTPVVLVGYSQGGYFAGLFAAQAGLVPARLVVINGRLKDEIVDAKQARSWPPTLVLHGEKDRFLPIERARMSAEALARAGAPVAFQGFPSGHGLNPDQITAAHAWLREAGL